MAKDGRSAVSNGRGSGMRLNGVCGSTSCLRQKPDTLCSFTAWGRSRQDIWNWSPRGREQPRKLDVSREQSQLQRRPVYWLFGQEIKPKEMMYESATDFSGRIYPLVHFKRFRAWCRQPGSAGCGGSAPYSRPALSWRRSLDRKSTV